MRDLELYRLIASTKYRGKLSAEDRICLEFANFLRVATMEKSLKAIWFHVANEVCSNSSPVFGAKLKAIGKIAGVADYIFRWSHGCGAIEVKSKTGKLSENQKVFQKWCESNHIPFALVRSCNDGKKILKKWGVLI